LTAIPVIQVQNNDISSYIPTNLISITDGQIILDPDLFNAGVRPAVNVGLSVSRVGGAAQTKAVKKVIGTLKLELAQYEELLAFSQFGSELSKSNQRALDRGARAIELLKQGRHEMLSFVDQTLYLFLLKERYLDEFALDQVRPFVKAFVSYIKKINSTVYTEILTSKELRHEVSEALHKIVQEFSLSFAKSSKTT
jgi:F-type H+-transporting ATPase subunit alpha